MTGPRLVTSMLRALLAGGALCWLVSPVAAQPSADLRPIHERLVHAMVEIPTPAGSGTGWLLEQAGRPVVVTTRATAEAIGDGGAVRFHVGAERAPVEVRASRLYASPRLDVALLRLEASPPSAARPLRIRSAIQTERGLRIVIGGHPGGMAFQTTEGVVTGQVSGPIFESCSAGRSCLVVDAPSFVGLAGGPALDARGELAGMLWASPSPGARFVHLIHVRAIAEELRAYEATVAAAQPPRPPPLPETPPREIVAGAMTAARRRVAQCGGSGRVAVTVVVAGTGRVRRVDLTGIALDPAVSRCIRDAMQAITFPPFTRDNFSFTTAYTLGR